MKADITATQASIKAAVMAGDFDRARLLIGRNALARMTLKAK